MMAGRKTKLAVIINNSNGTIGVGRLKLLSEISGLIRKELVLHGRAHPIHRHIITVLGLDRSRKTPYRCRDKAFRAKAMEFRTDQNQSNKEAAEAKFKEGLKSYEAIKKERKNNM